MAEYYSKLIWCTVYEVAQAEDGASKSWVNYIQSSIPLLKPQSAHR